MTFYVFLSCFTRFKLLLWTRTQTGSSELIDLFFNLASGGDVRYCDQRVQCRIKVGAVDAAALGPFQK